MVWWTKLNQLWAYYQNVVRTNEIVSQLWRNTFLIAVKFCPSLHFSSGCGTNILKMHMNHKSACYLKKFDLVHQTVLSCERMECGNVRRCCKDLCKIVHRFVHNSPWHHCFPLLCRWQDCSLEQRCWVSKDSPDPFHWQYWLPCSAATHGRPSGPGWFTDVVSRLSVCVVHWTISKVSDATK